MLATLSIFCPSSSTFATIMGQLLISRVVSDYFPLQTLD